MTTHYARSATYSPAGYPLCSAGYGRSGLLTRHSAKTTTDRAQVTCKNCLRMLKPGRAAPVVSRTVSAFMKTEAFERAANRSGNSTPGNYAPDSDGRIGRSFSGHYTVDEVRALLEDLEHVQNVYNAWVQS